MIGGPGQNLGAQDSTESQTHCQALTLLIIEVRVPQNLYSSYHLPY